MRSDEHRPNLLVILSDQHNPHVLGCAGNAFARTPNLDALARDGARFDNAYCAAPLCVPSRSAFLTGRYPLDLRVWTNRHVLDSAVPTFADALSRAGYDTVLCGRMHFEGPDQHHGFQHRLVGDVSGAMTGRAGEMFEGVWSESGCGQSARAIAPDAVGAGRTTYSLYDKAVTERACRWIAERAARGAEKPFCLVVGLLLPHNPYVCEPALFEAYMDRLPAAAAEPEAAVHPAVEQLRRARGFDTRDREADRRARAAYYGMVTMLDRNVGRIVNALQGTTLAGNTEVLYTSDHGDMAGEHGLWAKESFYEGSVRVPLIWRPILQSGTAASGRSIGTVTSLLDVSATLTDLAGAPPLPRSHGRSLRRLLESEPGPDDEPEARIALAETWADGQLPGRMVRRGEWKLCVYHGFDRPQLFNLVRDPEEQQDLGADPAFADIRDELLQVVRHGWDPEAITRARPLTMETARQAYAPAAIHETGLSERWPFPIGGNTRP